MRKIHLHGALGAKYGESFDLEVETAAEAVRAIGTNFPEFIRDIRDGSWHVVRGEDLENGYDLDEDELAHYRLGRGDLHIAPVVAGSKNSGTLKAVLGIALVGAAFFFSGGALATPLLSVGGQTVLTYGNVAMIGAALALAGASQLLAPEEKGKDDSDDSFIFSGPTNVADQGFPVPLVYGEVITGGVMISGGVDIERIGAGTNDDFGPDYEYTGGMFGDAA